MSKPALICLPKWLPNKVRNGRFFEDYPVGAKLLADHKVEHVWKNLNTVGLKCARKEPKEFENRLSNLPERYRRETCDWDSSTPLAEGTHPSRRSMGVAGNVSDQADALYRRSRHAAD